MANASSKTHGPGVQNKGTGEGAMTELDDEKVRKDDILSNRDKAQGSSERGQDSKWMQTEERKGHSANKRPKD